MKSLPIEVWNQVFILLHQQDKLECMAVCSLWRNVIENYSLFHTVRVSSEEQLNRLIQKVQQEPTKGNRVERLIFDVDCIKHYDLDILPFLFPNIHVFIFSKTFDQCDIPLTKRLSPHPWHNIEHMAEYLRNSHTTQTLSTSQCLHLTTLTIYGKMGHSGSEFIELLANAPSLRSLTISFYSFKLSDFELLHQHVPQLGSLSIENADINCNTIPHDIQPALSMHTFNLKPSSVYPGRHEITLLQYLGKKYPNLLEFSHGVYVLNEEEYSTKRVLNDGYAPMMGALGPKLKSFSLIYYDMDVYPFEVMDNAGCQINKLTLSYVEDRAMRQLIQSHQVRYIQRLTLTALLKFSSLEWLKEFRALKELTLCFPYPGENKRFQDIHIDKLLNWIGKTLETLRLDVVHFTYATHFWTIAAYPYLKSMALRNVALPSDFSQFISNSLPHLRNLVLDHCIWRDPNLSLPNINLSSLKIVEDLDEEDERILVTTLNPNEQRWYSAKPIKNILYYENQFDIGDLAVYPAMSSVPFDKFNGTAVIRIKCKSIQNIFIVNSMS
ncbi:hypothetical protein K501DRAFT_336168, partial [Backusella circina FSU 941]